MSEGTAEFGIETDLPKIAPEMSENEAVEVLVKLVGDIDINTEKGRQEYDAFRDFTELIHTRTNRTSYENEIARQASVMDAVNAVYDPENIKYEDINQIPQEDIEEYSRYTTKYAGAMKNVSQSLSESMDEDARLTSVVKETRKQSSQGTNRVYIETSVAIENIINKLVKESQKKGDTNPYMETDMRLTELQNALKNKFPELKAESDKATEGVLV